MRKHLKFIIVDINKKIITNQERRNKDEMKMKDIKNRIEKRVKEENDLGRDPIISYSIGSVISSHYPGKTLMELLEIADQRMYEAKKIHHQKYGIERQNKGKGEEKLWQNIL